VCVVNHEWRALLAALGAARWTVVEQFETGGERYLLARHDESLVPEVGALTQRERQVVAHLALGHTPKVIAYELGIAHSTVRVFITRICDKLGLSSSAELRTWASALSRGL
jgi:DNA-binding NarL/FixJ family response regulator